MPRKNPKTPLPDLALIYSPCGSEAEAESIARALLAERLIACANIYPSRSIYRWQGQIADESEYVLVCKTLPSRVRATRALIARLHSYEVPCILEVHPASANHAYTSWAAGEVAAQQSRATLAAGVTGSPAGEEAGGEPAAAADGATF